MKADSMVTWLTMAAMLLGAGIWLGKLQQQVSDLGAKQHKSAIYYHGTDEVP